MGCGCQRRGGSRKRDPVSVATPHLSIFLPLRRLLVRYFSVRGGQAGQPDQAPIGKRGRMFSDAVRKGGRRMEGGIQKSGAQKLAGKTAIVTGASSGIGRATALALAGEGAAVVVFARRKEQLDMVAAEIHALGGKALVVVGD